MILMNSILRMIRNDQIHLDIRVTGYPPFQMVVLDGAIDHAAAVIEARAIWPACEVDR